MSGRVKQSNPGKELSTMKKQIAALKARISDLEAFCGVMIPVYDREYKKGGWDFSNGKKKAKH